MKTVVICVACVVFFTTLAFAGMDEKVTEEKKSESLCPYTRFKDGCLGCHVMSGGKFVLRESAPDAHLDYPRGVKILNFGEPTAKGYFLLNDIEENAADNVQAYFRYLEKHKVTYAILDIQSGDQFLLRGPQSSDRTAPRRTHAWRDACRPAGSMSPCKRSTAAAVAGPDLPVSAPRARAPLSPDSTSCTFCRFRTDRDRSGRPWPPRHRAPSAPPVAPGRRPAPAAVRP